MKNQEKKKESVLGAIKKYKAEEKAKTMEKKEASNCTNYFFNKISSRKKKIMLLKVLLLCYNRNDVMLI